MDYTDNEMQELIDWQNDLLREVWEKEARQKTKTISGVFVNGKPLVIDMDE